MCLTQDHRGTIEQVYRPALKLCQRSTEERDMQVALFCFHKAGAARRSCNCHRRCLCIVQGQVHFAWTASTFFPESRHLNLPAPSCGQILRPTGGSIVVAEVVVGVAAWGGGGGRRLINASTRLVF